MADEVEHHGEIVQGHSIQPKFQTWQNRMVDYFEEELDWKCFFLTLTFFWVPRGSIVLAVRIGNVLTSYVRRDNVSIVIFNCVRESLKNKFSHQSKEINILSRITFA